MNTDWTRSTFCHSSECVEAAHSGGNILVRDSKNPDTTQLTFTHGEWTAFVLGVKAGEFDLENL